MDKHRRGEEAQLIFGRYRPLSATRIIPFGSVNKGYDTLIERPVTITILRKDKVAAVGNRHGYSLTRMRGDAALTTRHITPSLLETYDQLEDDTFYYVISEFTDAHRLVDATATLSRGGVLLALEIFDHVISTVRYLNKSGIFGCAVREENIFVAPDGKVRIDNLLSCRIGFLASATHMQREIANLALPRTGAFSDREANQKLDVALAGEVFKSVLVLLQRSNMDKGNPGAIVRDATVDWRAVMAKVEAFAVLLCPEVGRAGFSSVDEVGSRLSSLIAAVRKETRNEDPKVTFRSNVPRDVFAPGETIFHEGDAPCDRAFLLEEGTVQILKSGPDGKDIFIDVSKPGDIIGEMGLIDDQPRMATARAVDTCTVAVLTGPMFRAKLDNSDPIAKRLIGVLLKRLRYQAGEIARLKSLLNVSR